jgi:hypothetical protein
MYLFQYEVLRINKYIFFLIISKFLKMTKKYYYLFYYFYIIFPNIKLDFLINIHCL